MLKRITGCVVRIILMKGNHLLLVQGRRTAEHNHWELPGGKVGSEETYFESARRELREETGIALAKARTLVILDREKPHRTIAGQPIFWRHVLFQATDWYGPPTVPKNDDEITSVKWFHISQIPKLDEHTSWIFAHLARKN